MRFTKMHGLGNDFIIVNCFEEEVTIDPGRVSELICDRHFGIGADGFMLIKPSEVADFRMELYNADGSRAEMCGNGIRCCAKYVYDRGMTNMTTVTIETLAGIKTLKLSVKENNCRLVSVDMGMAKLNSHNIDSTVIIENIEGYSREEIIENVIVNGKEIPFVILNTGVPHAVIFVNNVDDISINASGPVIECHQRFPARTNVDYAEVVDRTHIKLRVWERGCGVTMACGTGASAAAMAAYLLRLIDNEVDVRLPGGTLNIKITETGHMVMTGPATEVFSGEFNL